MATLALRDIEYNDPTGKFAAMASRTSDCALTSEKQIDLVRQMIQGIIFKQNKQLKSAKSSAALELDLIWHQDTAQVNTITPTPMTATLKFFQDWKKEGEPAYLLKRIEDSSEIVHGKKIAHRIRVLRQIVREDEDGDIAAQSLRSFYEFLTLHPKVIYPEITLTPDGNIYAAWKNIDRSLFSIHFLDELRVRYVVFTQNIKHPHLMNRTSGTNSFDNVFEVVDREYDVAKWIME